MSEKKEISNEQRLAESICMAMEHSFEVRIEPPRRHLPEWTVRLFRWPENDSEVQMSMSKRINPISVYTFLPDELNKLVHEFQYYVAKTYNQKCNPQDTEKRKT